MAGGVVFDTDFAVATIDHYLTRRVRDQNFNTAGLLGWIESRVGTDRISGGDNILQPVNTAANSTVSSYSGFDTFNNAVIDTLAQAVFSWKQYYVAIVASAFEVERNQTREGMVNFWAYKVELALQSLRDTLNTHAFGDGTGNSGKNMLGLSILVDSSGTMGNIARASNAFWQAQELAAGGSLTIDGDVGMLRALHNASPGSGGLDGIDAWWSTATVLEQYERLAAPGIRYSNVGVADLGFANLAFRGAPMHWDKAATSGTLYGLSSSTFKYFIHPARDFLPTTIATAINSLLNNDGYSQRILAAPELVNIEPRRNVKITGIS